MISNLGYDIIQIRRWKLYLKLILCSEHLERSFDYSVIWYRTQDLSYIEKIIALFPGLTFSDCFVSITGEMQKLKVTMCYYKCLCQEHILMASNSFLFQNKYKSVGSTTYMVNFFPTST